MKRNLIIMLVALMAVGGSVFTALAGEHGENGLKLSQAPPAVQKLIKQEATKHPLESITMDDDGNSSVYEVKFRDGSQRIELKVAANGQVVSREQEQGHREDREERDD
jgi:hypothetical protein